MHVKGYITFNITFGSPINVKPINFCHLVVHYSFSSYNIIIGRLTFNPLGSTFSTLRLNLKYPLASNNMGTVNIDQDIIIKCFPDILSFKPGNGKRIPLSKENSHIMNFGHNATNLELRKLYRKNGIFNKIFEKSTYIYKKMP